MAGLFGGGAPAPQPLPEPKTTRMPVETDPRIIAAGKRTREAALARTGRMSTILTDQTNQTIGSGGQKLGA